MIFFLFDESKKKNIFYYWLSIKWIIWSTEMDLEIESEIQKYNPVTNHEIK